MAEITRLPSPELRALIVNHLTDARHLERVIALFAAAVRQAVQAFAAEIDPLSLSDGDYQRARSGRLFVCSWRSRLSAMRTKTR
ncbi:MAG: hypothetical protein KY395_02310 [Actinobacteria bacterium]|nr:hypothetical protein [Actinomycetota bacterium]